MTEHRVAPLLRIGKVYGSIRFVPPFAFEEFDKWIVRKNPEFEGVWDSERFEDIEGEYIFD